MADLVVITPSRGRPERLAELVAAVRTTTVLDTRMLVCVDRDDPTRSQYREIWETNRPLLGWAVDDRSSLSGWTNHAAEILLGNGLDLGGPPLYLASLGDDHRPRTKGWDKRLIDAIESLDGPGIAYGNDLLQGAALPTAWVVSAEVVRAVGWMMLPTAEHMYVDNAVLELGRAASRIAYVPDVVIEHIHPAAGKAAWDDSYRETNRAGRYAEDRAAFEAWKRDGLQADAQKLLAVRAGV